MRRFLFIAIALIAACRARSERAEGRVAATDVAPRVADGATTDVAPPEDGATTAATDIDPPVDCFETAATDVAPGDDRATLVGTWRIGDSYALAAAATEAMRLKRNGVLERGAFTRGVFRRSPNVGPSGPNWKEHYSVHPSARAFCFMLDGAQEVMLYAIDGPDRWHSVPNAPADRVTYYVRQP